MGLDFVAKFCVYFCVIIYLLNFGLQSNQSKQLS